MQIGSVVWKEFLHIHTHGIGLSIRVTLNIKPASQVLIINRASNTIKKNNLSTALIMTEKHVVAFTCLLSRLQSAVGISLQLAVQWTDDISSSCLIANKHPSI